MLEAGLAKPGRSPLIYYDIFKIFSINWIS